MENQEYVTTIHCNVPHGWYIDYLDIPLYTLLILSFVVFTMCLGMIAGVWIFLNGQEPSYRTGSARKAHDQEFAEPSNVLQYPPSTYGLK
jgi:hypothetical protein